MGKLEESASGTIKSEMKEEGEKRDDKSCTGLKEEQKEERLPSADGDMATAMIENEETTERANATEERKEDLEKDSQENEIGKSRENGSEVKDEEKDTVVDGVKKENTMDHIDIPRSSKNRVKLYVLCEQRVWDDRGTGHVACIRAPNPDQGFVIVVKLESTEKNVLESKVLMETVYQKQQETLIVWSESDTCDLALSFQEKSGCEEIWTKICEVQGKDPGDVEGGYDDMDEADLSEGSSSGSRVILPPVEMSRLAEIELAISNHITTGMLREKMANAVENDNVITRLVDLFHMCEDLDHGEGLRYLYSITKNLFMLNRNSINDALLDDKVLRDVIGMLEYDPAHEEPRRHREFLYEKAKFREVIPIASEELKEKIHKTYRVQYLQDVCLPAPSLFEENLLSVLNSYIFFSRIDIVTMLQKDRQLMKELFEQLRDPNTTVMQRRDLAFFLKEFITLSASLPSNGPQSKDNFYKALQNNDVLGVVEPCICSPDVDTRVTIVEMLALLVEHNPQNVRDYLLRQAKDKSQDAILLNRLINHMQTDRDPELTSANQVAQVLRTLLDPDTMVSMQKAERSEFLQLFYNRSIGTLVKPLCENVQGGVLKKDDYVTANRAALVVRLLTFCVEHHTNSMRSYTIQNDLLNKILVLLKSKHHFLSLSALKILRTVIAVKNDYSFYVRHIVKERVLDKVVECFKANGHRYNLLNSAILELFEFIRAENIKTLLNYMVENHMAAFEDVSYVKVFQDMKNKYEQNQEREQNLTSLASSKEDERAASPVFIKERQEEQWFEDEDEDDQQQSGGGGSRDKQKKEMEISHARKSGMEVMFPSLTKRKSIMEDEDDDVAGVLLGTTNQSNLQSAVAGSSANMSGFVSAQSLVAGTSGQVQDKDKSSKHSFVIKLSGDRSRTPSPSSPVHSPQSQPNSQSLAERDDEVTSSQPHSKQSGDQSPSSVLRSLVDYDESDSDEDENGQNNQRAEDEKKEDEEKQGKEAAKEDTSAKETHHPDTVPTSSTGSPVSGAPTEQATAPSPTVGGGKLASSPSTLKESSPDDDVSSTSGGDEERAEQLLDELNGHVDKKNDGGTYSSTPTRGSGKRPSSESLDDPQADVKRSRLDAKPESPTTPHPQA